MIERINVTRKDRPRVNVCIFVFAIVQCHFAIIVIFRQKLLMIKEIAYD